MNSVMPGDMVLVYDMRRDHKRRKKELLGLDKQWEAYLKGELDPSFAVGQISELFYAPYEGEHMFRLNEGNKTSTWIRLGDNSWYIVGSQAKVECVVFKAPHPVGDLPTVTRIWIGKSV